MSKSTYLVRYRNETGKRVKRKFTSRDKAVDFYLEKCDIKPHPLVRERYIKKSGNFIVEYFDAKAFKIVRKEFLNNEDDAFDNDDVEYFEWTAHRYYRALCHDLTEERGNKAQWLEFHLGKYEQVQQLVPKPLPKYKPCQFKRIRY